MQFVKAKRNVNRSAKFLSLLALGLSFVAVARAQSLDIASPSPVRSNEVTGTISARDIGDPRLTDHYYAFTGTPGDVLITIDSRNLNGDIDVFTSSGLRPLLKVTVYSSNSSPITKGIYLRKREDLILRVEARTPNDDHGTYRLSFSGSFEPIAGDPLLAESGAVAVEEALTPASGKKGRRVSSVGARIDEPPAAEVAAAPTPEPTPAETAAAPAEVTEVKPVESPEAARVVPPRPTPRSARTRRGSTRSPRTPPTRRVEEPVANTETAAQPTVEETRSSPAPGRRSTKRGGTARRSTVEENVAETAPAAESGPRLIIETNDGTLINRYMSGVRRVTVENGQIVVVGKDGKIERIVLASVLRMSIAP
ncbi:MAG: hypothetical protein AABN95_04995 [Acidobacteriota bacterium]